MASESRNIGQRIGAVLGDTKRRHRQSSQEDDGNDADGANKEESTAIAVATTQYPDDPPGLLIGSALLRTAPGLLLPLNETASGEPTAPKTIVKQAKPSRQSIRQVMEAARRKGTRPLPARGSASIPPAALAGTADSNDPGTAQRGGKKPMASARRGPYGMMKTIPHHGEAKQPVESTQKARIRHVAGKLDFKA